MERDGKPVCQRVEDGERHVAPSGLHFSQVAGTNTEAVRKLRLRQVLLSPQVSYSLADKAQGILIMACYFHCTLPLGGSVNLFLNRIEIYSS